MRQANPKFVNITDVNTVVVRPGFCLPSVTYRAVVARRAWDSHENETIIPMIRSFIATTKFSTAGLGKSQSRQRAVASANSSRRLGLLPALRLWRFRAPEPCNSN